MKNTAKHFTALFSAIVFAFLLALALVLVPMQGNSNSAINTEPVKTVSDEKTTLVPGEEYIIIFSSDTNQIDAEIASTLRSQLNKSGQRVNIKSDIQQKETAYELLIGNTNRALSAELKAACQAQVTNNSLVWGFAFRDGKFAYAAATDEAFNRGKNEIIERFVTEDFAFEVPSDLWLIVSLSRADYEAELEAEKEYQEWLKEQERLKRIEELKQQIAGFTFADFTDRPEVTLEYAIMANDGSWGKPALYPTDGEHPRLNVTKETLEDIKTYLETEEGLILKEKLIAVADSKRDGNLSAAYEHTSGRIGYHNMDGETLAVAEARAFLYLLTGDEEWGYKAILTMKNFFKTIDIGWIHSDQCREFGQIIFTGAEIYDWCYDLMTEDDKNQFMIAFTDIVSGSAAGTEYAGKCQSGNAYIEVGYPPKGQGSVSGHGSEHQILRDYLSVAIAIFDENPSWYEYVGARTYNDYIATRNFYYDSGTYQQGVNLYGPFRHNADLWSAWMLQCATGENPYTDMLEQMTISFFEYQLPDGSYFGTGDSSRVPATNSQMISDAMLVMGLYGNTVLRTRIFEYWSTADKANAYFDKYNGKSVGTSMPILISMNASYYAQNETLDGTTPREGESTVAYHSYPIGQMIARSEWNNEAAPAIFMKIGERTTSNHEHDDAGSFQIYYKGLYSGESGCYDKYGSNHFNYYHQSTVAHNALLIANPDNIGTDPSVPARYYYSGGQRALGEVSTLEGWLNDNRYVTGEVSGSEFGLKDDGTTDYVYLAGDITAAYESVDVSHVGRRMFTLFTDNEQYPMYFVVYDQITSTKDNYIKKFLLHTPTEPVIDAENKTVTLTDQDGRIVLHSLKGGDKFEALGGEGMNFLINGNQCATEGGQTDGMWGRVEISTTGALSSDFFNFIYVTDATNDEKLAPTSFEASNLIGTQLGSDVVVFAKSTDEPNSEELVFTTEGTGLNRYFVTGMYPGTWHIEVDGVTVAHRVSSEEGTMITFYAPAGEVHVKPGNNIAPSNGGRIIYNSFGGVVPDDAPQVYEIGVPVKLPENIKRGNDEFYGWYTSPTFEPETKVTELIGETKGKINVYAAFKSIPINMDFENLNVNLSEVNRSFGDLYLGGSGKTGVSLETVTNEATGNTFLRIIRGSSDPFINATQHPGDYMAAFKSVTYQFDLALDGSNQVLTSTCRLRENASNTCVSLFSIGSDGTVKLGGTKGLFKLTHNFQRLIITVDYDAGTMTAYNIFGDEMAQVKFSVPSATTSGATTTAEWLNYMNYTFNWYMGGKITDSDSLLLDNVKVSCGNYDAENIVLPEGQARIIYQTNGGTLPDGYPLVYTAGEPTELPKPTIDNGTFAGWYTTPTFDEGTEISVIERDTAENITVYAKYAITIFSQDFTDLVINATDASNTTAGGIQYQLSGKTGSTAKTVTDASGNTYLRFETTDGDPAINSFTSLGGMAALGSGKITMTIRLGTLEDGKCGGSNFRLRNSTSANTLTLFTTNAAGQVLLGGDADKIITTLNTKLQQINITIDAKANTITAYKLDGTEIVSKAVTAPSASGLTDLGEWLDTVPQIFNWYVGKNSGFIFDDVTFYTGAYVVPDEIIPEGHGKVTYETAGGVFGTEPDKYFPNDKAFTIPTDITNGSFTLEGWYTDPNFDPASKITEIPAGVTEIVLYAKWQGDIAKDEFTDLNFSANDTVNGTSTYFSFNTKGKPGSYAKTVTDENGNTYIEFGPQAGGGDAAINSKGFSLAGKAALGGGKITFTIDMARIPGVDAVGSMFRLRGKSSADCVYLFNTTATGDVLLGSTDYILTIGEEFTRIAITVDVYNSTITAYNLWGEVLGTKKVGVPSATASDYKNFAEWFDSIQVPVNWQFNNATGGYKIDNFHVYVGEYIGEEEIIPDGMTKVTYETAGGIFGVTPDRYVTADGTFTLPTDITNGNYTFGGWYASPDFSEASKITSIPAGLLEITVYAKWSGTVYEEDFTGNDFYYADSKNHSVDGNSFGLHGKDGSTVGTVADENGNTYIKVYTDANDMAINNFTKLKDLVAIGGGKFTFTVDLAKHEDGRSGNSDFRMRGTGNWTDVIGIFQTLADGSVVLGYNNTKVITTLTTEFQRIIITLDAYEETITAYDLYGDVIHTAQINSPSSDKTVAEWVNSNNYLFNWQISSNGGLLIDNIKVTIGGYTPMPIPEGTTKVTFETNGGEFTTVPDRFVPTGDAPFVLPTDLVRDGYKLDGWFTTADFTEGTQITEIPQGATDEYTVYAKWTETTPEGHVLVNYETNGGTFAADPGRYAPVADAAYVLPTDLTLDGYTFAGWYTTSTFTKGTAITEIPQGSTEAVTIYARWNKTLAADDFTGKSFDADDTANGSSDYLSFNTKGKTGSTAKTVTDDNGNTYVEFRASANGDPAINSKSFNYKGIAALGGSITFVVDMAMPDDMPGVYSNFRLRATTSSDTICLFTTDAGGKVLLNNSIHFATIGEDFTRIAITLDIYAGTLTAYNRWGEELATKSVGVPKAVADKYATIAEWLESVSIPVNWQYGKADGGFKIDNFNVYLGDFVGEEEIIPDGHVKVNYNTNGGTFAEAPDRYAPVADAAFTLPTDITNGTSTFLGWYTDPGFTAESKITEIAQGTVGELSVYAKWAITVLDLKAENENIDYAGKDDGSTGGVKTSAGLEFQTKGTNSFVKTVEDENGGKYILWSKGTGDPQMIYAGKAPTLTGGNKVITFSMTFAKETDKNFISFQARMRTDAKYGANGTSRIEMNIFRTGTDGKLYLGASSAEDMVVGQFGEEFKTLSVVVDFNTGAIIGYNENGDKVCQTVLKLDATLGSYDAMYNAITNFMNCYAAGSAETAIRVQGFTIQTGNAFE